MPNGMLAKREGRKIGKVVGGRGLGDGSVTIWETRRRAGENRREQGRGKWMRKRWWG